MKLHFLQSNFIEGFFPQLQNPPSPRKSLSYIQMEA